MIVYNSPDDPSKFNRGFAFLDYDSHKSASAARRTITSTRLQVWGSEVIVEWAEPQEEPDAETMSKVVHLSVSLNCTVSQKTCHFVTGHYLRQILTDFWNFFTGTFCIQFAMTRLPNIPPHLKCVDASLHYLVKYKFFETQHRMREMLEN